MELNRLELRLYYSECCILLNTIFIMFAVIYWFKTKLTILPFFILGTLTVFSAAVMHQILESN